MVFKKFLAAATAMAIVVAPEVALAQTNAAAARASAIEAVPAAESFEGDSEMMQRRRRGFIVPLFAITLVILGLIIVFKDNDGAPVSP